MSTVFVILLYSSGMPILYFIGMIFFGVTFWVHKLLILKFYQRSRTFNRTIPLFSQKFFKLGLAVHIIGATFMLTNPEPFLTDQSTPGRPHRLFEGVVDDVQDLATEGGEIGQFFVKRFQYLHQQIYLLFIVVSVVTYLIGTSITGILNLIV